MSDFSRPFGLAPEGSLHDVLIIGGASLDVYHLTDGQTVHSPGGAGLYTALAAAKSGARAAMFAPRPVELPAELRAAAERITWRGPHIPLDQLPRFEIAHYGGGQAALLNAWWGGEMLLTPDTLTPDQLSAPLVHVGALRTAERQLQFVRALKTHPALRLSVGTYSWICRNEPDTVRTLFDLADVFFMNEQEATLLFGSPDRISARPGQLVCVTLGERGALIWQGQHVTLVPGLPAVEVDPTGAGDTFCGALLAALAQGAHPVMAARSAAALAAEMIGHIGPTRLLSDAPAPDYPLDTRVRVNAAQVARIADLIAQLPDVQPFNFTGEFFPPIDDPHALDLFFAVTLQQFSFWEFDRADTAAPRFYAHPLIAPLHGRMLKGSDYLFAAYQRAWQHDPASLSPAAQAALTDDQLADILRADDGTNPMPASELHQQLARAYGQDMIALGLEPRSVVAAANAASCPRTTFLALLDHVGGYKEDPLRKKSMLLALILEQRPERFLRAADGEAQPPVIDYHLMRSCLRTGLIEVTAADLRARLVRREELPAADEWAVRQAAFEAVGQVQARSGRSMGAVDWFFFNARRRCPEMSPPECAACAIDAACAHDVALFQPVRRTTFY